MSDDERSAYERGQDMIREVYAGDVVDIPEGTMAFYDVMMKSLFSEVWDRDVLPISSRRLLIMGVIAARGEPETWRIQSTAALKRGEKKWRASRTQEYFRGSVTHQNHIFAHRYENLFCPASVG